MSGEQILKNNIQQGTELIQQLRAELEVITKERDAKVEAIIDQYRDQTLPLVNRLYKLERQVSDYQRRLQQQKNHSRRRPKVIK